MNEYFRLVTFDAAGAYVGEDSQTHDKNGNRISNGKHRLFFDLFDRLVRVERTSDGVTVGRYRYDAVGRRVHKAFLNPATGAQNEVFFVSDGAREIEELDGAGNVVADYVYGSLYVDQVVQMRRGGQDYYLHSNSLFSVSAVTDASGSVVERYAYGSVYGTVTATDDAGGAVSAAAEVGNPWRFTGRRLDPESGLYHYRLRYYDPEQGRFVSRDPLGMWGDPGQRGVEQGYCGGNPVNRVDPFGLADDNLLVVDIDTMGELNLAQAIAALGGRKIQGTPAAAAADENLIDSLHQAAIDSAVKKVVAVIRAANRCGKEVVLLFRHHRGDKTWSEIAKEQRNWGKGTGATIDPAGSYAVNFHQFDREVLVGVKNYLDNERRAGRDATNPLVGVGIKACHSWKDEGVETAKHALNLFPEVKRVLLTGNWIQITPGAAGFWAGGVLGLSNWDVPDDGVMPVWTLEREFWTGFFLYQLASIKSLHKTTNEEVWRHSETPANKRYGIPQTRE